MQINFLELTGYLAAVFMFSSFFMKKMIPLRVLGMASNACFIIYAGSKGVYPLLLLHSCLLPLNLIRMLQMIKLINNVRDASRAGVSMDFLVPYMTKENFKKGDCIFKRGDAADKMFFMRKGLAKVMEHDAFAREGDLIGEIGVFALNKTRTATIVCETDCQFLTIPDKQVLQLYYQNPTFGIHLVQLIIQRFERNQKPPSEDGMPRHLIVQPEAIIEAGE